jgi:hypothetical protein
MGWSGKNGETSNAPPPPAMRPHRLGLGATPKLLVSDAIPGKIRTADQVKRDEKLQKQYDGFNKQREERIAQDKQKTLQIGSLVYCHGRRAKLLQLQGVPGLSRVLVQFERDATKTSVKKGEISLISRPELDKHPFQEVELDENRQDKAEPILMQKRQNPDFELRSNNDDPRHSRHRYDRVRADRNEATKLNYRGEEHRLASPQHSSSRHYQETRFQSIQGKGYCNLTLHLAELSTTANVGMVSCSIALPERYLETALRQKLVAMQVVLTGKCKFAKGKLLERDSKSGKGVIQVFDDMSVR